MCPDTEKVCSSPSSALCLTTAQLLLQSLYTALLAVLGYLESELRNRDLRCKVENSSLAIRDRH